MICIWLHDANLKDYKPARYQLLTAPRKTARLNWCQNHWNWSTVQWRNVVFSGETHFNLHYNYGRIHVWRLRRTSFKELHMQQHDRFGGGSIMVWWSISLTQKSAFIHDYRNLNSSQYIDVILEPGATTFGHQAIDPGFIFRMIMHAPMQLELFKNTTALSLTKRTWSRLHSIQISIPLSRPGTC